MNLGSCQISLVRPRRPRPTARVRPRLALGVVLAVGALVALALPAGADNAATGTVTLAVRSVTVTNGTGGSTFSYDVCRNTSAGPTVGLAIPNGTCDSTDNAVTVTNGVVPDQIEISATAFAPSDGTGAAWTLCGTNGLSGLGLPACNGPANGPIGNLPGSDQAALTVDGRAQGTSPAPDPQLQNSPSPDARPGQGSTETASMQGPSSASDSSPSFSNVITWTAVPAI